MLAPNVVILLLSCVALTAPVALGQAEWEDVGPFGVAALDVAPAGLSAPAGLPAAFAGLMPMPGVGARIYYPTSGAPPALPWTPVFGTAPAPGPFPLVAMMHGFAATPAMYDDLCAHLASHGFVVVSISELQLTPIQEALDTTVLLGWVYDQATTVGSSFLLEGAIDTGADWGAIGHSMGGAALFYLIGAEPRVRSVVALQPFWEGDFPFSICGLPDFLIGSTLAAQPFAEAFTGNILFLSGTEDLLTPPSTAQHWFDIAQQSAAQPRRMLRVTVTGMGHLGPLDSPDFQTYSTACGLNNPQPLGYTDQHRLHRRLVAGFLNTEIRGATCSAESAYLDLVGAGLADEVDATGQPIITEVFSACETPVIWARNNQPNANDITLGVAGSDGDQFALFLFVAGPQCTAGPFPGYCFLFELPTTPWVVPPTGTTGIIEGEVPILSTQPVTIGVVGWAASPARGTATCLVPVALN